MAAFVFFQKFSEDFAGGIHDFDTHVFKFYLSNAAPDVAADLVKADMAEITAGNGYTTGGNASTITLSRTGDTTTVLGTDPATWTAAGGTIGPFRYAVFYNDTSASDSLIGYYDYGSAITLQIAETFTIDLHATNGIFIINPS